MVSTQEDYHETPNFQTPNFLARRMRSQSEKSLKKDLLQIKFLKQKTDDMIRGLAFAEEQIAEAKRRGLDGFDRDRFLNRRKELYHLLSRRTP